MPLLWREMEKEMEGVNFSIQSLVLFPKGGKDNDTMLKLKNKLPDYPEKAFLAKGFANSLFPAEQNSQKAILN